MIRFYGPAMFVGYDAVVDAFVVVAIVVVVDVDAVAASNLLLQRRKILCTDRPGFVGCSLTEKSDTLVSDINRATLLYTNG